MPARSLAGSSQAIGLAPYSKYHTNWYWPPIDGISQKCFDVKDLPSRIRNPIRFKLPGGGRSFGFEATILADICDAILAARKAGALHRQQEHIANQCEILVRGFARVGIIALIDEATGFQRDRAKDALAEILERFIAKELRPRHFRSSFMSDFGPIMKEAAN
jgi:hypothetical protein